MDDTWLEPQTEDELFELLEQMKTTFETETSITTELFIERWSGSLSPEIGAAILDVLRESLADVPAKMRARRVRFLLYEGYFMIRLLVTYSGVSFRANVNLHERRLKLDNMCARVTALGGTFEVMADESGVGTKVRIVIPKPYDGLGSQHNMLGSGHYTSRLHSGFQTYTDSQRVA